ncbi:hypothetical protein POTOM_014122 [Populus tomentosa]|uniref:Homeobox-leucine zipper protein n=1 Tax=Populus tomentosa TaxID=118781 RepID=A0A8X8A3V8_POPTO|nr:hypothetical protein POTOM_014122 [Populus tomentosa]
MINHQKDDLRTLDHKAVEKESRPELEIKQQLANEIGLEPRQVAIWFQNRRARLKTKQIEKEYSLLKANYEALASRFESLKRENQSLLTQKLKNQRVKQHGNSNFRHQSESSHDGRFEDKGTDSESKRKPSFQLEGNDRKEEKTSSDNNSRNIECMWENIDILNQTGDAVDSMTSSDWQSFQSNCFLDELRCSSQWWELLS